MIQVHQIQPVYNQDSKTLILGSFPSVVSRKEAFYYAHAQNRFWKVLSFLYNSDIPKDKEEKKSFLLSHNIALWDVIASCDINASSDSSITNVKFNDIKKIIDGSKIDRLYFNGKTAEKLYNSGVLHLTGVPGTCLPSTSPANASWSFERLCEKWSCIL